MLLYQFAEFAGQCIRMGDAGVVIRALAPRLGRVHQGGRQFDLGRIVTFVLDPGNMRVVRAEKQAERLGLVARGEELLYRVGIGGADIRPVDDVEVVVLGPIVVRHLAEAGGFIAQGLEYGGQSLDARLGRFVVRLGAVAGGPQAR